MYIVGLMICARKKTYLYLLLIACLSVNMLISSCQNNQRSDTNTHADTVRMHALYHDGLDAVGAGNRTAAAHMFNQGMAIARAANDPVAEGEGYLNFHYLYMSCGKTDSAQLVMEKALDIFRRENYKGHLYFSCRIMQLNKLIDSGQNVRVTNEGIALLKSATTARDTQIMIQTLSTLARAAESITQNEKGLDYIEQATMLARKAGKKELLQDMLINLAFSYDLNQRYTDEQKVTRELLAMPEVPDINRGYAYARLATACLGLQQPDSALFYLNKVAAINEQYNDATLASLVFQGSTDIYLDQKNYTAALQLIEKQIAADLAAGDSTNMPALQQRRAEALEHTGRYKEALEAHHLSEIASNEQSGAEIKRQVAFVEGKYKLREKEAAIQQLARTSAIQRKWLMTVLGLLAAALAFFGLAIWQYYRQRRANKVIAMQAERLQWLMKEIHHRIKNNLHVIISLINMQIRKAGNPVAEALLHDTAGRILSIAVIHQRLYQNKDPEAVALEAYLVQLSDAILEVQGPADVQVHAPVTLDTDTTIMLGLVVAELITNSGKHARVPGRELEIRIDVSYSKNEGYTLRYTDNGPGIPEGAAAKNTLGMQIIALMVRQMGGSHVWTNSAGAGLTIRFKDETERKRIA